MDAFVTRRPKATDAPFNDNVHDARQRPTKRLKSAEVPDSESDDEKSAQEFEDSVPEDSEGVGGASSGEAGPTDFDNALLATHSDEEALKEYEALKLSQGHGNPDGTTGEARPLWVKGRSSIYVDAFNLALDSVLDEESHLFDKKEKEVFRQWRGLEYEAQFMYVCPARQKLGR
jgi:Fanconi-associated nuclease 1